MSGALHCRQFLLSMASPVPVTARLVGHTFVSQYYNVLHRWPHMVYGVYTDASRLTRSEAGPDGAVLCSRTPVMRLRQKPAGFFRSGKFGGKDIILGGDFSKQMALPTSQCSDALLVSIINFPAFLSLADSASAESLNQEAHQIYGDLGAGIELGVQVLYLAVLLSLVGVASFFVMKQLLIRRELESAARDLQDRVRTGEALPVEYFELGAVMLRKKFYALASKYLEQAIKKWDGDPQDLAQVHNALGYGLVCDNKLDRGIAEYEKAVKLQPGYVVAWNNLGSAYEKKKNLGKALEAYEQALLFDPNNSVAREYRDALKKRVDRLAGVPIKLD